MSCCSPSRLTILLVGACVILACLACVEGGIKPGILTVQDENTDNKTVGTDRVPQMKPTDVQTPEQPIPQLLQQTDQPNEDDLTRCGDYNILHGLESALTRMTDLRNDFWFGDEPRNLLRRFAHPGLLDRMGCALERERRSARLHVTDSNETWTIIAELPGVSPVNISVTVSDAGSLVVHGSMMRTSGPCNTTIAYDGAMQLPFGVDSTKIQGVLHPHGMLEITVPKSKQEIVSIPVKYMDSQITA